MTSGEITREKMCKKWGYSVDIDQYANKGATHIVLVVFASGKDLVPVGKGFAFTTLEQAKRNAENQWPKAIYYCTL